MMREGGGAEVRLGGIRAHTIPESREGKVDNREERLAGRGEKRGGNGMENELRRANG